MFPIKFVFGLITGYRNRYNLLFREHWYCTDFPWLEAIRTHNACKKFICQLFARLNSTTHSFSMIIHLSRSNVPIIRASGLSSRVINNHPPILARILTRLLSENSSFHSRNFVSPRSYVTFDSPQKWKTVVVWVQGRSTVVGSTNFALYFNSVNLWCDVPIGKVCSCSKAVNLISVTKLVYSCMLR